MPVPISCSARVVCMSFGLLVAFGTAAVPAQPADAAAHRAWMNDAADAQEDFRFAVSEKDARAAGEALAKIDRLMASTEEYWASRKAADGVAITRETRTFAQQAAAAVKAGDLAKARDPFDAMGARCNACHDLHLEKR
jgi:hypothetical protein